jgi:hypothetical protein
VGGKIVEMIGEWTGEGIMTNEGKDSYKYVNPGAFARNVAAIKMAVKTRAPIMLTTKYLSEKNM